MPPMHFETPTPTNAFTNSAITIFFSALVLLLCSQNSFSQGDCSGNEILTKTVCSGDEITKQEREIARLVNEYRRQNNLSEVPVSDSLSLIANRHALDMSKNLGYLTHSWSDCTYKIEDSKSWNCIFYAPKRFNPNFSGIGFENVYHTTLSQVAPFAAVKAWKKSPLHNSTMLNLSNFKKFTWTSIGVAIDGKFAAIWFTTEKTGSKPSTKRQETKGLGVTFEKAIKGLTSVISINNVSSSIDSEKWTGTSSDKSVVLEMFGKTKDIAEANMALRLRVGKRKTLSATNRRILDIFVGNLAPTWAERNRWITASLKTLRKTPRVPQKIKVQNAAIQLVQDADGFISFTIKPKPKIAPYEVK